MIFIVPPAATDTQPIPPTPAQPVSFAEFVDHTLYHVAKATGLSPADLQADFYIEGYE